MQEDLFRYFCETTAGFVFSTRQKDIPAHITGTPHEREVKTLFTEVRGMAVKKSLQLPESFCAGCDRDDWVQLAMIAMFECCEKYDRKRPFDNYVRFMVSRKMADHYRSLMRKNPPVGREILYIYNELKKNGSDQAALEALAEDTGKSVEQLREIVVAGVGARTFTSELTANDDAKKSVEIRAKSLTPEQEAARQEMKKILELCVAQLPEQAQMLFRQHEFEDVSFKKLFAMTEFSKAFATFKRWYKNEIYDPVRDCVLNRAE